MSATTKVSTMAKTRALGMKRSTTLLIGRIRPESPADLCFESGVDMTRSPHPRWPLGGAARSPFPHLAHRETPRPGDAQRRGSQRQTPGAEYRDCERRHHTRRTPYMRLVGV